MRPLKKKTETDFQDRLSLNAGQKYCRRLQVEHSAILSTVIKLPFVIKIFVLSIFEWPLKTGFTVHLSLCFMCIPLSNSFYRLNTAQITYLCSLLCAWSFRACVIAATLLDCTLLATLLPSSKYPAPLIPALRPGLYSVSEVLLSPETQVYQWSLRACVIAATLLDCTLLATLLPSSKYPAPLIPALRPGLYSVSEVRQAPKSPETQVNWSK